MEANLLSNKKYIIAYNLGTTGNKSTIFDDEGNLVASAFSGYRTYYPNRLWVEQNPKDWWNAICNVTKELLEKSKINICSIVCLTFSGQMMGCVPVNKDGEFLGRALIWADQRGVKQAEKLIFKLGKEYIYKIVGKLKKSIALELDLIEGIPIVIGGGDGCCAAAGAGVISPGVAYQYLGSSSWIGLATEKPIVDPQMRTFNWIHVIPGLYSPTGTM